MQSGDTPTLSANHHDGDRKFTCSSTSGDSKIRTIDNAISGSGVLTIEGRNKQVWNIGGTNSSFSGGLTLTALDRYQVTFNASGSAGTGNVTVTPRTADARSAVIVLGANNVFASTATLTLNGKGGDSSGWPYTEGDGAVAIDMKTFNATVSKLYVLGVQMAAGNYTGASGTWITGTGTLTVGGGVTNTAPVATAQSVSTAEDTAKAITLAATDADSNPLTYAIASNPAHGTLSGTAPNVTYTPASNYNGADSFTFKANDGIVDSSSATVSITVMAVNDTPVATAQSVSTAQNTAKAITLTGTDIENSALTYTIVTQPAHGTLSGTAPNVTYTPTTGYTGADSFTFRVNDGTVNSANATVSITVTGGSSIPLISGGRHAPITAASDIQSSGVSNLAGADFGRTNGTTTVVNNGSVNVSFVSMLSTQSAVLPNGITVSATGYNFNVDTSAPAGVTGTYRTVMTKQMGVGGGTGSIILSGLSIGTTYQIQVYITGSDPNTSTISGSPSLVAGGGTNAGNNNGFGQYCVGTFTADATSKTFVQTANTNEPVINALTIGTVGVVVPPGGSYDSWVSNYPGLTNTAASVDFDKGGLPSGIERVLGGDPTSGSDDASIAPIFGPIFGSYAFSYRRSDAAYTDPKTTIVVEYSSDFMNWTTATAGTNITITENNDYYGAGVDSVTVVFAPAVAAGGKVFVRLKATVSP